MFGKAKNGRLQMDGTTMDYIAFGKGKKTFIMIPGLGDGLTTVKGLAIPFSRMYKEFTKTHRVYVFSRKNDLPAEYTSREMADDLSRAMDELGIEKADVMGVSQGGTIAQYLALNHPEKVERLVLTVTYARPNDTIRDVVTRWIDCAEQGDFGTVAVDTAERSYSEAYLKKYRKYYRVLRKLSKPKNPQRFLSMARACLTHNCYDRLGEIKCPTLIISGGEDKIVTNAASVMMSCAIPGSRLYVYPSYGHGAYDEAKDFNSRVNAFINGQ
ncbi:MAG: alpha/beta hydrolase [Ruminococcaceae bacterium]|nr:alpha/beta hydrolase [Oscillospiraceae bacterium]